MIEYREIVNILNKEFTDYERVYRNEIRLDLNAIRYVYAGEDITLGSSHLLLYYRHKKSTEAMTNILIFNPLTKLYMKIAIINCPSNMMHKNYTDKNGNKMCLSTRAVDVSDKEKASFDKAIKYMEDNFEGTLDSNNIYFYTISDLWNYYDLIDYLEDGSYKTTFGGRKSLKEKGFKVYDCIIVKKRRQIASVYELPKEAVSKYGLQFVEKVERLNLYKGEK